MDSKTTSSVEPETLVAACPFHGDRAAAVQASTRKTLVLTGASRGIGHATVQLFSSAGWRVITCSRHAFASECPWDDGEENHVTVDLAEDRSIERAIDAIRERVAGGAIHALVNNAGMSPKGAQGERLDWMTTPVETWAQVIHVNFLAPVLLARGLLAELKRGQGSIVNVTSIVGGRVHPFAGTAYATSKAALSALTREMAADLAPHGIRVNSIAPGEIRTEMISPETEKVLAPTIPMRRLGSPDEVAQVVFFLCSKSASYVTGEEIQINGGQHV